MKRFLCFLIIICMLPVLSGCGSIFSNYREIEQLLVIQTMGIDRQSDSVMLSLASSADSKKGDGPVRLSSEGPTITETIDRLYNYSNEEDLFLAHVDHVLIGEDAAERGINEYLAYFCRSPDIRIDVPVYIIKGGSAKDAVMQIGDSDKGVSEVMEAVKEDLDRRGDSSVFSAAEIICNLTRHGSALICAVECSDSSETSSKPGGSSSGSDSGSGSSSGSDSGTNEGGNSSGHGGGSGGKNEEAFSKTAAVVGYGIIVDDRLCGFLDRDESIGAGFILNEVGLSDITVRDKYGATAVLEIEQGETSINPVWSDDGALKGINVHADVHASVMELNGSGDIDKPRYADHLTAQLESAVSERISAVLQRSVELKADFLGLASRIEISSPCKFRRMTTPFNELLPDLELQVSVSGALSHTNDIKDV